MEIQCSGYYDCLGDKRVALLRAGDPVTVIERCDNHYVVEARCRNSEKIVRVRLYPPDVGEKVAR